MKITFDDKRRVFRIANEEMEYAFAIAEDGNLTNLHWGHSLGSVSDYELLLQNEKYMMPGERLYRRSEYGFGEPYNFAQPCLRVRFSDGVESLRLRYQSHKISDEELSICLADEFYPFEVTLKYKLWGNLPLITRSALIKNCGQEKIVLYSALSASLHLPIGRNFRLTHYSGDWSMEYIKNQEMLTESKVELSTSQLTAAAVHHIPFFALDENGSATERHGEVYFGALLWSGDFRIVVETMHMQNYKCTYIAGGVNDYTSQIPLAAGEEFETPEFAFGFSSCGFEKMSEILYDWQYDYLLPKGTKGKSHTVRPIIYNTWYPYEFDIDEEKLIGFIPRAKRIGAELFVIDDGWMRGRTDDKCGLGDWFIDQVRFPHGLGYIADAVHQESMLFGLWVEPEMVNPHSELYNAHPDWVLCDSHRKKTLWRNQMILDFSRDDIRDWAIGWLDTLIESAKLDYLKWDMNREITEKGAFALESGKAVKYMRNIEYIWQHLSEKYPDLLLENCAAGSGRADFGMMRYADRINRSDNADPIDVMILHEGYSTLFVPKCAGGAGNVAPSPYYINGRSIPLDFRIVCGMTGSMSIGINLLKSDEKEMLALAEAVNNFKKIRVALQDSYVYRIASAYENLYQVLEYVKRDKSQFTIFAFGHGMRHKDKQLPLFRMRGLIPEGIYKCDNMRMSGAALMGLGVEVRLQGDYAYQVMTWVRE